MRRNTIWLLSIAAAALVGISCGDAPTSPGNSRALAPGGCAVNVDEVNGMPAIVFGTGTPTTTAVRARLDELYATLSAGNIADAQAQAHDLVSFVHEHLGDLKGTIAQLDALVNTVLCWVGLPETSFIVPPSSQPQVLKTTDGNAGIQIPANGVSEPTVVTITVVDGHLLTPDDTKLDRYPRSVSVTSSVPVAASTVGVCLTDIPSSVFPRLRMGHRTKDGFKIEPPAPVDFLNCGANAAGSASKGTFRRALSSLARFILPKPLFAKQESFSSGGVGGTAGEYSPFEPVDVELSFSGGVGGTAGEYFRRPDGDTLRKRGSANLVSNGVCSTADAIVNGSLEVECRPRVLITTANGTVLQNVPVSWAVGATGGLAAAENPTTRACGIFGASASTATNANGKAGACWTLGANVGAQTLVATVTQGGDAPPGVIFSQSTQTFTATALAITPTATATGESVSYDGAPHPGTGACTNGLAPALSYSGDGSVPMNIGQYTLTVTCGAGNANVVTATATAAITITPGIPNISISCPASIPFTGLALTPCSATVNGASVALTYSANVDAGTASARASVAATANYSAGSATREFQIARAVSTTTVTCPASVVYAGVALTPCTVRTVGPQLDVIGVVTYNANRNAGTATANFEFAEGGNYLGSSDMKIFAITRASATATAGSGSMATGGTVPTLPCFVTVLPVDADAVSCTTVVPSSLVAGTNITTPNFTANPNYNIVAVNGTLTVGYIQSNCLDWPLSPTLPPKSSGAISGIPIAAVCVLRNGDGSIVTNASGDLEVFDIGPEGSSPPVRVVSRTNAFDLFLGAYWAWITTGDLGRGHYYSVSATWSDGSSSGGYFYIR